MVIPSVGGDGFVAERFREAVTFREPLVELVTFGMVRGFSIFEAKAMCG
jgi:hypothetical protein